MNEEKITVGCHGDVRRYTIDENGQKTSYIFKLVQVKGNFWYRMKSYFHSFICERYPSKIPNYIKSYRVEHNFYKNNQGYIGIHLPKILKQEIDHYHLQFVFEMEDLFTSSSKWDRDTILKIIHSLALFHKHFWNTHLDYEIWNRGGYWTDNKRIGDKSHFKTRYETFIMNVNQWGYDIPNDMKERILNLVSNNFFYLSEYNQRSPQTLIHGDLKLENIFIKNEKISFIDWQWTGYGNVATDLMYLILTSIHESELNQEAIFFYLKEYQKMNENVNLIEIYQDFKIAAIDFFSYLVCCKWYDMTLEKLNENKKNKKDGIHVQSATHILSIIYLMDQFAKESHSDVPIFSILV